MTPIASSSPNLTMTACPVACRPRRPYGSRTKESERGSDPKILVHHFRGRQPAFYLLSVDSVDGSSGFRALT
jgi:hypothetical protein